MAHEPPAETPQPPPSWQTLRVEGGEAVRHLVLARPAARNAVNTRMLEEIADACTWLERRPGLRAVILRSEGPTFCAGADLKEGLTHAGALQPRVHRSRLGSRAMQALADLPAITIAAVQGHAIGGGACLPAACDFRIGATDAQVSVREVSLGLSLSWNAIPAFVHLVGPSRAKEMIVFGDTYTADTLRDYGYFNAVVAPDALLATAEAWAARVVRQPPLPVQMAKASVNAAAAALDRAVFHLDPFGLGLTGGTRDAGRAREAFFRGEPADWEFE